MTNLGRLVSGRESSSVQVCNFMIPLHYELALLTIDPVLLRHMQFWPGMGRGDSPQNAPLGGYISE